MAKTPVDLFAFGNRSGPKRPRTGIDVFPDAAGMVGPEQPPLPRGFSSFADIAQALLNGHYHVLPKGTELPAGVAVVADGVDVEPSSPHAPTHYTLYPAVRMLTNQFVDTILFLPWKYVGRK